MTASARRWWGIVAGAAAGAANRVLYWQRWRPRRLGTLILLGFRADLRGRNLFDSGRGPVSRQGLVGRPPPTATDARTLDGTDNDLTPDKVLMGSTGSRFGRNRPVDLAVGEPLPRLVTPDPALISERLMKRTGFKAAERVNLLAAGWIQFQIHDWFDHGPNDPHDPIYLEWPPGSERNGQCPMRIERTRRDPDAPAGPGVPAMYVTAGTHWWDASQLYGVDADDARARRAAGGDLAMQPDLVRDLRGTAGNSWVGLEVMEQLFRAEHNAIAAALREAYPAMSQDTVHEKARLVNAALMAKIHTLDWTTAMLSDPTSVLGLRQIWWGVTATRPGHRWLRRWTRNPVLSGIPGSARALHGVDYAVTEEFVAVYRMHPLLPDDIELRRVDRPAQIDVRSLREVVVPHVEGLLTAHPLGDLVFSLGTQRAGQVTLHNYPETLRDFTPAADPTLHVDLAAVDILRIRERGVPRYNEFRRMMHMRPLTGFDGLGGDDATRATIADLYDDIEDVDLLVGLYAEDCPDGFAFSETAFRMFLLMAERRLEADRFFTAANYTADTYTEVGFEWVQSQDMRSVLLRHCPELSTALAGATNPFAPWDR